MGRTVYTGPVSEALPYFASIGFDMPEGENPADFFLDITTGRANRRDGSDFDPAELFGLWERHTCQTVVESAQDIQLENQRSSEANEHWKTDTKQGFLDPLVA